MTQEELKKLTNISLVELLLNQQIKCTDLKSERDAHFKDILFYDYNEIYYAEMLELIEIKFAIIKRMGGVSGTGN